MADQTRQWFGDSTLSYALAVINLFEYARTHPVSYAYGPLDVASMRDGGLVVSGSPEDLEAAAAVLAQIPGLAEHD